MEEELQPAGSCSRLSCAERSQGLSLHPLPETLPGQNPALEAGKKNLIGEIPGRQAGVCSSIGEKCPLLGGGSGETRAPKGFVGWGQTYSSGARISEGCSSVAVGFPQHQHPRFRTELFRFHSAAQTFFRVSSRWSISPSLLLVTIWGETKGFFQVRRC